MPQNFKRHTLIRKIKDGGIGIIDPEIKIKATEALLDIDIKTQTK